eukprot:CAMPEP_0195306392 /NCGR_PEP_ID=MMETSP0707-20130614/37177_1 /TAXON_ID=33640 /ORGANISM="Asterionellopsis glacialis, Strain CCMP134" /LENGTH=536 /DNA_ID=CAMNT_0040370609 /DNA_START=618 /DNA_END=2228 /DNA_ORIENTATION=-
MVNNLGLVGARAASLLLLIFQIILFPVNMVNGNNLFKLEDPLVTTATYEYQIEFNTTTYMNVEEALDKLDEDSKKRLEEDLGEEEDLAFEIASNTLRSCETPMTFSDMCFEAQSVVTITSTIDNTQDVYIEQATVEEVQNFMDTFNTDNPDIYISFIGPFYISSELTIDIAPVQSKMDDMAREVFEFVLVDHLEESFESVAEDEIVVSNLRADVLFEVLSAMQRTRQRRLQPTTGRQQNRVSVFVSGTCNRCSGQDALISDAANKINYNDFMNDLKKEGSNAGTDYFDGLDQASYDGSTFAGIDKPVIDPVSDLPDDKDQPFWIWIALGIAVVMQRTRQRRLQPTTGRQQNRVSVFVSGTCNRCSGQDTLISDAANKIDPDRFVDDLKTRGNEEGTEYFDELTQARYGEPTVDGIDKPVVGPVGDVPRDKKQPFWIWIALGIAVVAVGGMFAFLYLRKRAAISSESKGDFASAIENNNEELAEEAGEEVDVVEVEHQNNGSEQDPLEAEVSVKEYEGDDSELNRRASRPGKYGENS